MLIISEVPESTFLFRSFLDKKAFKELSVTERDIVTSQDLPGIKDKKLSIVLQTNGESITAAFSKPLMVNGVECRTRKLKKGDLIRLGRYRLIYEGEKWTEPLEQVPSESTSVRLKKGRAAKSSATGSRKRKQPVAALVIEAAAVLSSLFFLWFCSTQNPAVKAPISGEPEITEAREHEAPPVEEKIVKKKIEELKTEPESPVRESAVPLVIFSPGEIPEAQKLDILFIHAHPDDETLDYGLSIASAAKAGMKVGVLTFTDGESGFDFYPDRDITGIYPDRELKGKELAAVRIQEESRSLKILGASMYIRLGLKNRPYLKEEASKSIQMLIQEWGGRKMLIADLTEIFSRLSPDIIVSPDGPSAAREHFEHEAVGYITDLAVSEYQTKSPGVLSAYLKLVDPQQRDAYPGRELLSVKAEGASFGNFLIKKAALSRYQTQADACYYGIKRLKQFPVEYYFFQYRKSSSIAGSLFTADKS